MSYIPNDLNYLWRDIFYKDWSYAEEELRSDKDLANSIGCISGISQGTLTWTDGYGQTYNTGEYPLSTVLRMEAPDSLILALLDAHENAASIKDMNGLLLLHLAIQENYTSDVIKAIIAKYSDAL